MVFPPQGLGGGLSQGEVVSLIERSQVTHSYIYNRDSSLLVYDILKMDEYTDDVKIADLDLDPILGSKQPLKLYVALSFKVKMVNPTSRYRDCYVKFRIKDSNGNLVGETGTTTFANISPNGGTMTKIISFNGYMTPKMDLGKTSPPYSIYIRAWADLEVGVDVYLEPYYEYCVISSYPIPPLRLYSDIPRDGEVSSYDAANKKIDWASVSATGALTKILNLSKGQTVEVSNTSEAKVISFTGNLVPLHIDFYADNRSTNADLTWRAVVTYDDGSTKELFNETIAAGGYAEHSYKLDDRTIKDAVADGKYVTEIAVYAYCSASPDLAPLVSCEAYGVKW